MDGHENQLPCAACQDCRAIHGRAPAVRDCVLMGCYRCADLAKIRREIASTYQHLRYLVKEEETFVAKTRHHTSEIHKLPVEIYSTIFVFVKKDMFDYRIQNHPEHIQIPEPPCKQPSQSPPLLLGAVCKSWRDITLTTPGLWTDIIVDLSKSAEGQLHMVKKWGDRSGALPLDITIFLKHRTTAGKVARQSKNVLSALRSLAIRWNDIVLGLPASLCSKLFDGLEDSPPFNSLSVSGLHRDSNSIILQHPLRPRHFMSFSSGTSIPIQWDRLVSLTTTYAQPGEVLHIIRHARNLRDCFTEGHDRASSITHDSVTNHSLIFLATYGDMLRHLTLPSLRHLKYDSSVAALDEHIDSVIGFFNRRSAPLDSFVVSVEVYKQHPFPPFEGLPWITSLILYIEPRPSSAPGDPDETNSFFQALARPSSLSDALLPRLQALTCTVWKLPAILLSSLSQLLRIDDRRNLEDTADAPAVFKRPLSEVNIFLQDEDNMEIDEIDKDTLLRLLEARKSGFKLHLTGSSKGDLLDYMAKAHGIEL